MKIYKEVTKRLLAEQARILRARLELTQEEMAEELHISSRSYGELERGRYCFSAVPLVSMLSLMDNAGIEAFLDKFSESMDLLEDSDMDLFADSNR